MKIKTITDEEIIFDNGNKIWFDHDIDCSENNYADFQQLDSIAKKYDYDENLVFEAIENSGFRFGDSRSMFFVPCYSVQNGYYTSNICIYYNHKEVLSFNAEMRYN